MKIVTNNPMVNQRLSNFNVVYLEGMYLDVLKKVRDLIVVDKLVLLTHPLSGSIKPNETYYKSILVGSDSMKYIDMLSLEYIEQSLIVYDKFIKNHKHPSYSSKVLNDFAYIDFFLIDSALESMNLKEMEVSK